MAEFVSQLTSKKFVHTDCVRVKNLVIAAYGGTYCNVLW